MDSRSIDDTKSLGQQWITIISVIASALPIISFFAINACNNPWLKILVTILLVISFLIAVLEFYRFTKKKISLNTILVYVVMFLICLCFSIIILIKKCDPSKKEVSQTINSGSTTINNNIDNSNHIDNTKIYNVNKEHPRKLDGHDRKLLNESLPNKEATVWVQYIASRTIDTVLCEQIMSYLKERQYENVQRSLASVLPDNPKEKISIRKVTVGQKAVYKVMINPIN